jgi:hypothetical protein
MTDIQTELDALQTEVQQLRQERNHVGRQGPVGLRSLWTRWFKLGLGVALGMALVGGVAVAHAAIPGAGGVISGCYKDRNGDLRVIDTASATCDSTERLLTWNQTGPAGPTGSAGPAGVSNYETVRVHKSCANANVCNIEAPCPSGKRVLGGGVTNVAAGGQAVPQIGVNKSGPSADATKWQATAYSTTGPIGSPTLYQSLDVDVAAICAVVQ